MARIVSKPGELSEATLSRYQSNPRSKSHVPKAIRDLTTNEVRLLEDIHHGPRQHKLNGAFISRDWSSVRGGDWWNSDDCTLPLYYYVPDGKGWFTLMRGQFLLMMDLRTTCILGYALQSERNYNARVIRTLITRVCDNHHLPRKGFYFENNIWRNSKILKGDSNADAALPWGDVELGLREFGLRFVHAKLPRAKPIERVLGMMQDLMEGDPGYAGRDERYDRFERFQKLKLQVEAKKIHPSGHFYDLEQWDARLRELCDQYNATEQNGKMAINSLPPEDALQTFNTNEDPPVAVDSSWRHLLAHHKRPIRVTGNGITLRFGKQVFNYKGEATGKLKGKTVIAWFNPELPEIITVTDMERNNPVCIQRSLDVPAMEAPEEIFSQELARIEAHQSYAKVRYNILQKKHATFVRPNFVSPEVVEVGRVMGEQTAQLQQRAKSENRQLQKARKVYSDLGAVIPKQIRAGTLEPAERLQKLLSEDEA